MGKRLITEAQIAEAKKTADQKLAIYRDLKAQNKAHAQRQKRALDSRRKILAGAWVLSEMQKNGDLVVVNEGRMS
jgi:hypothetical protein